MAEAPWVCVVGSINMDMVTTTKQMPMQGETVMGGEFATYPGGKGANQAVAAARLGANVIMIGAVGDDAHGGELLKHFQIEKIDTEAIRVIPKNATGIATIILSDNDNRIIVIPGANGALTPDVVDTVQEHILRSDVILLQLEIPIETVAFTIDLAAKHGIPVILNPAPYQKLPEALLTHVTYLTPNEIELDAMRKLPVYDRLKPKVVMTQGARGVTFTDSEGALQTIPAYSVNVKDTTGAGDTFNGALAVGIASKHTINDSVKFANAASALAVGKVGAQNGMPTREDVLAFLSQVNKS